MMQLRKQHCFCFGNIIRNRVIFHHLSTILVIFSRVLAIFFTNHLEAIKSWLSIEDRNATIRLDFINLSNTLLMYIKKNIYKTRDLNRIPILISRSLFLCPSMTSWTF